MYYFTATKYKNGKTERWHEWNRHGVFRVGRCVCVCLNPAAAGETLSRRSLQLPLCGCLLTSSNGLMCSHSTALLLMALRRSAQTLTPTLITKTFLLKQKTESDVLNRYAGFEQVPQSRWAPVQSEGFTRRRPSTYLALLTTESAA